MGRAIDLNDEGRFTAKKIHGEWSDRMLPYELDSFAGVAPGSLTTIGFLPESSRDVDDETA
jgi:hypothetical protein